MDITQARNRINFDHSFQIRFTEAEGEGFKRAMLQNNTCGYDSLS